MKHNLFLCFLFAFISCNESYTPKPRAYFKIELPEKKYKKINTNCSFNFEIPLYSELEKFNSDCFYNINFPEQNAILHLSYFIINNNLLDHCEQARDLAYKHSLVADAISEQIYIDHNNKIYSILYDYEGNTATSSQFYITDSVNHFFRGALYFNTEVSDSLSPVNDFLKQDIMQIIQTFRWKD